MTQHHEQGTPTTVLPPLRRRAHDHKLTRTVAGIISSALLLTGCTTPPATPPSSTTAPSPTTTAATTTPAPTPTTAAPVYKPATDQGPAENVPVPVLTEQAKEFSKEGLIAFTEHWYSTLGYAFETGDPEPMMAISGANCIACTKMAETVVPWHSDGRWIVGGQMTVLSSNTSFTAVEDGSYEITALVRQNQLKFYRGDQTLADDHGQNPSVADLLTAAYDSGQWSAISVIRVGGG